MEATSRVPLQTQGEKREPLEQVVREGCLEVTPELRLSKRINKQLRNP